MNHKFRNFRALFTAEEYVKYERSFWAVPSRWSVSGDLARWRMRGGDGLTSFLPLLGMIAGSRGRNSFALAKHEIARLVNIDPATLTDACRPLIEEKLLVARVDQRNSEWLTHWSVDPSLSAASADRTEGYFTFPLRLLHGGIWAMMPKVLRSLYIAAATRASGAIGRPDNHWVYNQIHPDVNRLDIFKAFRISEGSSPLRMVRIGVPEWAKISGVGRRTVYDHLGALKHPLIWPDSRSNPKLMEYMPLWAYPPKDGRDVILHFRDHAPNWPYDVLNLRDRNRLSPETLESLLPVAAEYERDSVSPPAQSRSASPAMETLHA